MFMQTVLEGLRGDAARNERVTWKSLEAHVIEATNDMAIRLIEPKDLKEGDQLQTPHSISNISKNPILVDLKDRSPPKVEVLPFNFADKARSAAKARSSQEAWAKKLGVEVVETNTLGMQMTLIPPGEFMMGSTPAEVEAYIKKWPKTSSRTYEDEQPQYRAKLTKPFRMAAQEVTVAQFRTFVDAAGYKTDGEKTTADGGDGKGGYGYDEEAKSFKQDPKYTWRSPGFTQADNHPVVNVSHNDAVAFVKWLNEKEGTSKYRLPSEAMWEYACRAGTTTWYQSGDDPEALAKVGNVADGTAKEKFDNWSWSIASRDGYDYTSPVGRFPPNYFGLFDLHGNAWEWSSDSYDEKAYEKAWEMADLIRGSARHTHE